ncbi:MAG: hypothetical protein WBC73_11030 [Phormidesmis sp.]
MQDNGTHNSFQEQQNEAGSTHDNVVTFPSSSDTQLRDISTLLQDAPVIQQQQSASKTGSEIATAEDFAQVEESRPFARKIGPKALLGMGLSLLVILPLASVFVGGGNSGSKPEQAAEVSEASGEEGGVYVSAEEYAMQQAELEQLRSQQAFIDQQVDAEAIDAAGRQRQQRSKANAQPAQSGERTASRATTSTSPRPAQATAARPGTVAVRPAPAPPRSTAAVSSRLAPVTTAVRSPAPATQRPSTQPSAREPEPVDPFERRAQLQALGSYGAPPPMTKAVAEPVIYAQASNPFETQYIQAIALKPQAQPAIATSSKETTPIEEAPLTAEELQYQQDAAVVLSQPDAEDSVAAVPEPDESEAVEEASPVTAAPMAIMPGTSTEAELTHGFSWQAGAPLPEVILSTTEDIMAGEQVAIPAGSQFLGQAQIDPDSGMVAIQIVGMFGEASIQIPRASVIVQAEDGSVLMASASGGASRTVGPNVGGFLMESLGNGLGNVIGSDDNIVIDVAGGVAETIIDNQVDRSESAAAASASRASARPIVWTLNAGPVRLTFNNYIPLANARL